MSFQSSLNFPFTKKARRPSASSCGISPAESMTTAMSSAPSSSARYSGVPITRGIASSSSSSAAWTSLSDDLPRGSARCLREDLVNPDVLWLGTEFGAFATVDGGAKWLKLAGLPNIPVRDLVLQERENDLVLAVHLLPVEG